MNETVTPRKHSMSLSSNTDAEGAFPRRLHLLDGLRGFTLINMIAYHFLWDLIYIAGIRLPWYSGRGALVWQQCICQTFIFLSGFCWSFGRHPLKRGLTVFLSGGLVTLVTLIFVPENRVIFGVLTLIGSCMLLMIPLDRLLGKIKRPAALIVLTVLCGLLFLTFLPAMNGRLANFSAILRGEPLLQGGPALPEALYHGWLTAYLGFPAKGFYSADYFPLLPWFFMYAAGYLVHRICGGQNLWKANLLETGFLRKNPLPRAAFLGRHSLLIYLLHQPVLYAVTLLIMYLQI